MKKLFSAMHDALSRGEDAVLCSIIASAGSTPRGSGAKMAVFSGGTTVGTIGGGAVEYESIRLARRALTERTAFTQGFRLSPNQTADIGMICGGQVVVYFQFFSGADEAARALFSSIISLFSKQENTWLVTEIRDTAAVNMGVYAREAGVLFTKDIPAQAIAPLARPRAVLQSGEPSYYVEPLTRAETVYVFGGGHVSQELVPLLAHIGFSIVVYEERPQFADPALFPAAVRTITAPYAEAGARIGITSEDYVVILTRGHQGDLLVLEQMLRTPASYIGVIGSRHKIAATNQKLLEAGIPEDALARIHTPIGLPIGAETPAEIAVSIAAELIQHRAAAVKGANK